MTEAKIFSAGVGVALVGQIAGFTGSLSVVGHRRAPLGAVRIDISAHAARISLELTDAETDDWEVARLAAQLVQKNTGCTRLTVHGLRLETVARPDVATDGFVRQDAFSVARSGGPIELSRKVSTPADVYADPLNVPWNLVPAELGVYAGLGTGPLDILDLGCGYGKNAAEMLAGGHRVVGVDIAPAAVDFADRILGDIGEFTVASALDLPFADASFDAVVDVGCIHCLDPDDRPPAVGEIARVLRSGGLLRTRMFKPRSDRWLASMPFRADAFGLGAAEMSDLFGSEWEVTVLEESDDFHLLEGRRIRR